ncbi:MAG: hypothetical protein CL503_05400 [Actinobacteria bacterium]|nr:hypothetical protein [Actinomycetota bacterium]|tara:strand:+ start:1450 stop:1716 length:267 start_codon:yes stop_codon:yes gene_type:complete
MAGGVELETANQRINEGVTAGNDYIDNLESIRNELSTADGEGASLGVMVGAQLKMTEIETQYMVRSGIPKKASSANMQAAQEVKKAAG